MLRLLSMSSVVAALLFTIACPPPGTVEGEGEGEPQGLVINEIDYDFLLADDNNEFIEVLNPTNAAVDLTGLQLVLITGTNATVYRTIDLAGIVPANGYFVLHGNLVIPAVGAVTQPLPTNSGGTIQNGAPDAVLLYDNTNNLILDLISYEGTTADATVDGVTVSFAMASTDAADSDDVLGSLCRVPNASGPFAFCERAATPGAAD